MKSNLAFDFIVDKEKNTVNVKREFDANLTLVWEAWTNPEILDRWWAPAPFQSSTKSMNFKVGGRRLYAMISPEGNQNWSAHDFTSVNPKDNFSFLSSFTDENGNPNSEFGASDWNVNFDGHNETTTVTIIIKRDSYEELEKIIAMGFKEGFKAALENLDEYFISLKK